jgi:phosphinothricin acetyltransferase
MGFASYGSFRAYPANKYTLEHSVYVANAHRGKGIASLLMQRLIELAQEQNYHTLIGSIDASNQPSIALHEKLGFTHAGTIRHAGFKFGDWLDLAFYQLLLPTPFQPIDG